MAPLTIYRASAGSGKTYQLTLAYLRLLFKNPEVYRHILAVTFTNKAAKEMKVRILDRLANISKLKPGEQSDDLSVLIKLTGYSEERIIRDAGNLLVRILNDYSRLSVGTIDKFFQGVIRAFILELGLSPGYSLEMDTDRLLDESIDMLYANIADDKEMKEWLLQLAESRIEESKGWNFNDVVKGLSKQLFTEKYHQVILDGGSEVSREQIQQLFVQVNNTLKITRENITNISLELLRKTSERGYGEEDFHMKSRGPVGFLKQLSEGKTAGFTDPRKAAMIDVEKWLSKLDLSDQNKLDFVQSELMTGLRKIYSNSVLYNTANSIRQHLYSLGIINDIGNNILKLSNNKNIFLISDTSRFLKGLIADNPTPFIYEKTGNHIDHIMLDEFQDTSVFQWENFKPLLNHTLSTDHQNIIVGDVKQSIYRWRNSDWKILAKTVNQTFNQFGIKEMPLDVNWRSCENIIQFNNRIFGRSPEIIWDIIENNLENTGDRNEYINQWKEIFFSAYADVYQKTPKSKYDKRGYIKAEILEGESPKELKDAALDHIPRWIMELQDAGYRAGEIAILVRTNKEGAAIADCLMGLEEEYSRGKYKFDFISNDSLFLENNPAVRFLVHLLYFIEDPSDDLNNLNVIYFFRIIHNLESSRSDQVLYPGNKVETVIGEGFIHLLEEIRRLPLFELTERLIAYFSIEKNKSNLPFIQAFQEVILEIQQKAPGSLHDFLKHWKEYGARRTITVSDMQDAIRIATIHKSKGLQYKAVIIPFCDWPVNNRTSGKSDYILWCSTQNTPFNEVPYVPLSYKNELKETLFALDYMDEMIMGYIDSLNLLYVGMTRAEESLLLGISGKGNGQINTVGDLVKEVVNKSTIEANIPLMTISDEGFIMGTLDTATSREEIKTDQVRISSYPVNIRKERLILRLKNTALLDSENILNNQLAYGIMMHEILSQVITTDDLSKIIGKYRKEGVLRENDGVKIFNILNSKLNTPDVRDWFNGSFNVLNERDIIAEGETYRPDRVMFKENVTIIVDYKFGEMEELIHQHQLLKYIDLLKSMNYKNIRGYIWYVMSDNLIQIK